MAHKKKHGRKSKKHHCVFAGKKKLSCHATKGAAKKAAKSRRKRGLKASVKTRAMKR